MLTDSWSIASVGILPRNEGQQGNENDLLESEKYTLLLINEQE